MKNIKLTRNEKNTLAKFESGKLKRIKGAQKEAERYKEYATYTLRKPRTINIRISQKTFRKIKAVAARKGLPYQTFISSLIHQYSAEEQVLSSRFGYIFEPNDTRADNSLAKKLLGWTPEVSFEKGIKELKKIYTLK